MYDGSVGVDLPLSREEPPRGEEDEEDDGEAEGDEGEEGDAAAAAAALGLKGDSRNEPNIL